VNLVDELHAIAAALRSDGIRYAVCGGLAVTIYGRPQDIADLERLETPDAD